MANSTDATDVTDANEVDALRVLDHPAATDGDRFTALEALYGPDIPQDFDEIVTRLFPQSQRLPETQPSDNGTGQLQILDWETWRLLVRMRDGLPNGASNTGTLHTAAFVQSLSSEGRDELIPLPQGMVPTRVVSRAVTRDGFSESE